MKYRDRIRTFELVRPGPRVMEQVRKYRRVQRWGSLSDLKVVDGMCKWCEQAPVKSKETCFRLYCGRDCSESATAWFSPQKPTAKAYLLIVRQEGSCARCKEDFTDMIDAEVERRIKRGDGKIYPQDTHKVDLWQIGYTFGSRFHVDHTVPIFKGGESLGLDNAQVLCVPCHAKKTAEERRVK